MGKRHWVEDKMGRQNQIFIVTFSMFFYFLIKSRCSMVQSQNNILFVPKICVGCLFSEIWLLIFKHWNKIGISVSNLWRSVEMLSHIMHDVPNILTWRIPPGGRSRFIFRVYHVEIAVWWNIKRQPWHLTWLPGLPLVLRVRPAVSALTLSPGEEFGW